MYCTATTNARIAEILAQPCAKCLPEHIATSASNDIENFQRLPSIVLLKRNSIDTNGIVLLADSRLATVCNEHPQKTIERVTKILKGFQQ